MLDLDKSQYIRGDISPIKGLKGTKLFNVSFALGSIDSHCRHNDVTFVVGLGWRYFDTDFSLTSEPRSVCDIAAYNWLLCNAHALHELASLKISHLEHGDLVSELTGV